MSQENIETTPAPAAQAPVRKERTGEVLAAKMQKTIVVRVERRVPPPQVQEDHPRPQQVLRS